MFYSDWCSCVLVRHLISSPFAPLNPPLTYARLRHNCSMASSAPKLPPVRMSFRQRHSAIDSGRSFRQLLVPWRSGRLAGSRMGRKGQGGGHQAEKPRSSSKEQSPGSCGRGEKSYINQVKQPLLPLGRGCIDGSGGVMGRWSERWVVGELPLSLLRACCLSLSNEASLHDHTTQNVLFGELTIITLGTQLASTMSHATF